MCHVIMVVLIVERIENGLQGRGAERDAPE
jgi:hypothetical protein